jgi:hypothetical protein
MERNLLIDSGTLRQFDREGTNAEPTSPHDYHGNSTSKDDSGFFV